MNRKGFTLIELLSVIIILGVIMTIAVPNVLSVLDRNKKDTMIENAKSMATLAEYTIRKNVSIDYPNAGEAIILTLGYLNTNDISESPYGTFYSPSRSFVAVVNETNGELTEYKYYVHLIACVDEQCTEQQNKNKGINLTSVDKLSGIDKNTNETVDKFSFVKENTEVEIDLGNVDSEGNMEYEDDISSVISTKETGVNIVKVYYKNN